MLMQSKRKIEDFWAKHKGKGKFVTKNDVRKMLNHLGVDWDEPSYLFYYLSVIVTVTYSSLKSRKRIYFRLTKETHGIHF